MENCPHYEHDSSMREVGKHLYQPGRCKINDYVVDYDFCKIDVQANCPIFLRAENTRLLCRVSELEQENGRLEGKEEGLQGRIAELEADLAAEKRDRADNIRDLTNRVLAAEAREKRLRERLEELVNLKRWNDIYGKTKEYLERQPKAWDAAQEALKEA